MTLLIIWTIESIGYVPLVGIGITTDGNDPFEGIEILSAILPQCVGLLLAGVFVYHSTEARKRWSFLFRKVSVYLCGGGGGGGGGGGNAWTIPFLSSSKDINDVTGEGTYSLIHSQRDTTNSNDNLTSLTRSSEEGGGEERERDIAEIRGGGGGQSGGDFVRDRDRDRDSHSNYDVALCSFSSDVWIECDLVWNKEGEYTTMNRLWDVSTGGGNVVGREGNERTHTMRRDA